MINSEYELLSAIASGELSNVKENYSPNEEVVNQTLFERLHREGYIHTGYKTSNRESWGYIEVSLTSKGLRLLKELKVSRAESNNIFTQIRPKLKKLIWLLVTLIIIPVVVSVIANYLNKS